MDRAAPAAARHAVTTVLTQWGFTDPDWLADAAVLVSELVSNAVRHGGGCADLQLQADGQRVTIAVTDASPERPCRRDPYDGGGRGLALVEAMSAAWWVTELTAGKQVLVELLPCPVGAQAPMITAG